MWTATMTGMVERRLLVNYRVDPEVMAAMLPAPFEPQIVHGCGVAGICVLRLGQLRPRGLPRWVGLRSENMAHRFAVEWTDGATRRVGVYIPRRDSASIINVLGGDRVFPGAHERAAFSVSESESEMAVSVASRDGAIAVDLDVSIADELRGSELFASAEEASAFFRSGCVGYSPSKGVALTGMEMRAQGWAVEPTEIRRARSSFFDEATRFPAGSIALDSALVMRNIAVEWHGVAAPRVGEAALDPAARLDRKLVQAAK